MARLSASLRSCIQGTRGIKLIKSHTSAGPDNSFFFDMQHSCSFYKETLQDIDDVEVLDALQNKTDTTKA